MTVDLRGVTTVLLPGTGSDDDYVYRAFSPALHAVGAVVVTPTPRPEQLVAGYHDALDQAAAAGPVAVGGVSIGAAVAVEWALAHPGAAVAVFAALPAWSGSPVTAPAAMTARYSAHVLRRDGLVAATAEMRNSSPRWLADELTRSWAGQWPALPDAMDEAAAYVAPTRAELQALTAPLGVVAASDDPVHPIEVALEWVSAAPRAALRTVTLDEMGADPSVLGAAGVAAVLEAAGVSRR
ncbi:thioesterase domain-containing protein [Mycolicibacterium sp. F2034L]|uniref:thioesterase domain-containing protein n=1 Tax=Mycolicibacterium sp. F2034L TaxID=2926422 RepID=UPI001FF3BC1A|nr:thioesterase domain-containing protein [Mycolicibacterium sp. F2034L]MCK0177526.1 alpha/beta fold hydrolase [Mycolicibacterium sp. F2034L]